MHKIYNGSFMTDELIVAMALIEHYKLGPVERRYAVDRAKTAIVSHELRKLRLPSWDTIDDYRLDDPRHGQAAALNAEFAERG